MDQRILTWCLHKVVLEGVTAGGCSRYAARKQASQARILVNESKDTKGLPFTHNMIEPRQYLIITLLRSKLVSRMQPIWSSQGRAT